ARAGGGGASRPRLGAGAVRDGRRPRDRPADLSRTLSQGTARKPHPGRPYARPMKRSGRTGDTRGRPSPAEPPLVAIIDDDASVRQSTRRLIRSFGYCAEAWTITAASSE